jgi:hypothetical protein
MVYFLVRAETSTRFFLKIAGPRKNFRKSGLGFEAARQILVSYTALWAAGTNFRAAAGGEIMERFMGIRLLLLSLGLFLATNISEASAGRPAEESQIYLLAVGEVAFANVTSGPWMDVQAGDPVWMYFVMPEIGEVIEPGHAEGYDVIQDSFVLVINDVGLGLRPGSLQPTLFVTDDYPVADTLVMGPRFHSPGRTGIRPGVRVPRLDRNSLVEPYPGRPFRYLRCGAIRFY